jgi:hypothetical protein
MLAVLPTTGVSAGVSGIERQYQAAEGFEERIQA